MHLLVDSVLPICWHNVLPSSDSASVRSFCVQRYLSGPRQCALVHVGTVWCVPYIGIHYQKVTADWAQILLQIREAEGSNLGYPDWGFACVSPVLPGKCQHSTVTYRPIARQLLGKHIPMRVNARNNRASVDKQRITKHLKQYGIIKNCVFHGVRPEAI
jgi:hypothetical protein